MRGERGKKGGREGRTLTHFSGISTGEHNPRSVIPSWGKAQLDPGAPSTEYQWGCYYQLTHTRSHTHTGTVEEKAQTYRVKSGVVL